MTEQPAAPAVPAQPDSPNFFQRLGHDVEGLIPHEAAVTAEIQALLRGHSATLLRSAADILEAGWPGAEPVASRILEAALGVAKVAGIAL